MPLYSLLSRYIHILKYWGFGLQHEFGGNTIQTITMLTGNGSTKPQWCHVYHASFQLVLCLLCASFPILGAQITCGTQNLRFKNNLRDFRASSLSPHVSQGLWSWTFLRLFIFTWPEFTLDKNCSGWFLEQRQSFVRDDSEVHRTGKWQSQG